MHPKELSIHDYTYELPKEKIADKPLAQRDESKLLVWNNGVITDDVYRNISNHLPVGATIVFNNTKVIAARVLFKKATGGIIEIFCLEPAEHVAQSIAMQATGHCSWKCMIGGASKWKSGALTKEVVINGTAVTLSVHLEERLSDAYVAEFTWEPNHFTFAEIIQAAGEVPLPPYIKRHAEESDKERYQTIFAREEGSVAAPTAGLHFTEAILTSLASKNIRQEFVTLHVGAGTFKPVKADVMAGHDMHAEWIDVSKETIQSLLNNSHAPIIAVGTTSARTLETLYWLGVKASLDKDILADDMTIRQWDVYDKLSASTLNMTEALQSLLSWMETNELNRIITQTQLLIAPGYTLRVVNILVTNFHQPQSTLLLLVAAAVGQEWRSIYDHALQHDYRFLSYGDGCLLFLNAQS
jgi:S-adenosylmethionine:tRNA ribosyltransferase-isomerase